MRVLFVTLGSPHPPVRGTQIRDFELIRRVASRAEVGLISVVDTPREAAHLERMRNCCAFVRAVRRRGPLGAACATPLQVLRRRPLATVPWGAPTLDKAIRGALRDFDPDLLQIEHSFLAPYIDALPPGARAKTVLSLHNVGSHQYRSMLSTRLGPVQRSAQWLKARLMRDWETRLASRFDLVLAVSEMERSLLVAADPSLNVAVVENGVDVEANQPIPEPCSPARPKGCELLFVGHLAYLPNADAVRFLADEIFPRVRLELPEARLRVVGSGAPGGLRRLARRAGIELIGFARDLRPHYSQSLVALVPLRAGGGTRLKVLEAMALGRALVSTSLGCAGLPVHDHRELLVADHAADFATAVVRLARDANLRSLLRRRGRRLAEARFSWDRVAAELMTRHEELARG